MLLRDHLFVFEPRFAPWLLLLVLPLLGALLFVVMRGGVAAVMPPAEALLVYLMVCFPGVWAANLASIATHRVLAPWRPPLWLICGIASVAQAVLLSPWYRFVFEWAEPFQTRGQITGPIPLPAWSFEYLSVLAREVAPGVGLWIGANYALDRLLGVPRFRYADAPAVAARSGASAGPPAFLERARLPREAEVLAITAEEHYVRIVSSHGMDLVRYRFSEALEDLAYEPAGMQVHRSWWVRLDRVASYRERGKSIELALVDGSVVPVSLAFREAVIRQLARLGLDAALP